MERFTLNVDTRYNIFRCIIDAYYNARNTRHLPDIDVCTISFIIPYIAVNFITIGRRLQIHSHCSPRHVGDTDTPTKVPST